MAAGQFDLNANWLADGQHAVPCSSRVTSPRRRPRPTSRLGSLLIFFQRAETCTPVEHARRADIDFRDSREVNRLSRVSINLRVARAR